jgi:hypothetical membrane protein
MTHIDLVYKSGKRWSRIRMVRDSLRTTPARAALLGACGVVAFVTFNAGWILGDLAQPQAFSPARDDISDLGALTASSPWLYNQLAANVSGLLVVALGIGLWRALSPSRLGRLGAALLIATGVGAFLDGIFRLDCQGITAHCSNDSWHSHAHKIESAFTGATTILALLILTLAFRRIAGWRGAWLPMLVAVLAVFAANVVFSVLGPGAATRAGTVVVFSAFAFLGLRLLQSSEREDAIEPQRERRDSNPRPPA